ncbi:MAG: tRNA (adenosine(37)-N6)-threonylcarbamoyltransferase complex ATPase subunit type 1 TsaE [Saprospiraceae bacterium]|nr:tRNA (adenosine(37)-N6)-threonylcarbamoyltransferase complex ATPase subunit type 1 TsaE [Saprospiraceae bacterium]
MSMEETYHYTLDGIDTVAALLAAYTSKYPVVFFYGGLGAGKTTLIKEICLKLGVSEDTSSPTFAIVNEYEGQQGPVYHLDLYRFNSIDEVLEAGIDEYLFSGHMCLVEWPQLVEEMMAGENVLKVHLFVEEEGRKISIES